MATFVDSHVHLADAAFDDDRDAVIERARHTGARARGMALRAKPEDIVPITTAEFPTAATRPHNSRLDTTRLRQTFDLDLPHWTAGVDEVLDQLMAATR